MCESSVEQKKMYENALLTYPVCNYADYCMHLYNAHIYV